MKKYIYTLVIILFFVFIPKVNAQRFLGDVANDIPLEYGTRTWAYNFSSATTTTNLTLDKSNGADGGVYYFDNSVTTGTYGIGFGTVLNDPLMPNHTYRIIYAGLSTAGGYCGQVNRWTTQFYPSLSANQNGLGSNANVQTYDRLNTIITNGAYLSSTELEYNITDVCYYFMVISTNSYANSLMLPFNTTSTVSGGWRFYGYNIQDLGSSSSVTQDDIDASISNAQQALINNANTNAQNIINNQNQNAQQAHQDSQNTQNAINGLKDDTVNSNTGKSFFDNFSDNTHGLSGIITAPLNIIQQLINVNPTSCSALSTTYHNKTISMECGKIFWGHTGFSDFNVFYNMVVGGAFCYLIIKDLFLTIEKLKDPDNDKVEVMDL